MICKPCQEAGDLNPNNIIPAFNKHKECKGDCPCQHKTGPGWYVKAGAKPTLMQTQSP